MEESDWDEDDELVADEVVARKNRRISEGT